jgi:hypothetical protein
MTPDEFARAAYPLLHEGIVLLRAHAGEGPAIERYVTMVEKVRAQYRAAKEAPAPAPEPSAPPAGAPACKAWCGTSSSGDSPGDGCVVFTRVRRCFCSAACCNKLRPLNPPPSDPVTVATGGVPAGYRLGDGWTTSPPPRWTCTTESRCGDYAKYAHLNDPRDDGEGGPGACAVHAVSLGALVPIDTAAVPPGPVPETLDDLAARPSKTHAEASARAAAIVLGTPGPVAVEAAPVCKPDCGTAQWVTPGAPAIVTMWWCSDACGKAGRPLYRAPAPDRAPPPAAPASEPTVRPLSATDERDGLLRCRGCGGYRPDGNTCQCELAIARAEVEQLRGKLAEAEAQLDTARLVIADRNRDRDAARAEIERLRKRLPLDTGTAPAPMAPCYYGGHWCEHKRTYDTGTALVCLDCGKQQGTGTATDAGEPTGKWRAGRKVGRTLYLNDALMGVLDTPELAAQVVAALNGMATDTGGEAQADAIKAAVAPHVCKCSNGPCPKCGGHGPSGEWSEGSDVTCDDCGAALIVATVEPCGGSSTFEAIEYEPDEEDDRSGEDAPGAVGK